MNATAALDPAECKVYSVNKLTFHDTLFALLLLIFVLVSRYLTSGPVYFADGPCHLEAIANHSFVIQPPGYWLFNRFGGLFQDPEHALLHFNWCLSAAGAVAFYLLLRRIVSIASARLGAILFASVFFVWFSGNAHSTYASQLLFAALSFYLILLYRSGPSMWLSVALGISFAVGAGLRPSDGLFLIPMGLYFLVKMKRRDAFVCAAVGFAGCLLWILPTIVALRASPQLDTHSQLSKVATGAILLGRLNVYTISNLLRFVLPLLISLGILIPFAFVRKRSEIATLAWLWVLPGSLFFLLVYISDAPYLDYLVGGIIVLALLGMERVLKQKMVHRIVLVCILINVAVYSSFRPLPDHGRARLAVELVNRDIGSFTWYAVKHQMVARLTEMMGIAPKTQPRVAACAP